MNPVTPAPTPQPTTPPELSAPKYPRAWDLPIVIVDKRDMNGVSAGEQWASRSELVPVDDYRFALRLAEQYSKDRSGQAHAVLQAARGADYFVTPLGHVIGGGRLVASTTPTNLEPQVDRGFLGVGKKNFDFVSVERITPTVKAVASSHHLVEFKGDEMGPLSVDPPPKPDLAPADDAATQAQA